MEYDVFFSYHSRDHQTIDRIARALGERGLRVFLDRWYLTPGQPWPQILERTINASGAVAVFIGPSGMGNWQHREQALALERQAAGDGFPVIPVLLPGSDPPLGFLRLNTWIDLRAGVDELSGLAPLEAAIRGRPPGPDDLSRSAATRSHICPYRGLQVFREEDAEFFCGRDDYISRLRSEIEQRAFTVVVGASGSGKSSLVKAGVIPRLRRHTNRGASEIATVVPNEQPLHSFAAAVLPPNPKLDVYDQLALINRRAKQLENGEVRFIQVFNELLDQRPGSDRVLLFVDQWEELYTACKDASTRDRFLEEVLDACSHGSISVVATLRGDFYGKALSHRALADRMQGAVVNLGPMTDEELRSSIQIPAEKVELEFESGLVDRIVEDVGHEPGNLPLLEFVLKELWEQRSDHLLTHAAYDSMRGVKGAVASRAESVIRTLSAKQVNVARQLLVQMVRPGEGTEDTRRRTELPPEGHPGHSIVQKLVGERLIVTTLDASTGRELMAVTHEALIRNWQTLRDWVDEDREFLLWRQRLRSAVDAWTRTAQNPDSLLRGPLLAEAADFVSKREADLSAGESEFIESSRIQRQKELAAAEAQLEEKRNMRLQKKRVVMLGAGLVLLLFIASVVTGFWRIAVQQRRAAEVAEARAENDRQYAVALNLASQSRFSLGETPDAALVSALLAVESLRTVPTPDGYAAWAESMAILPASRATVSSRRDDWSFSELDLNSASNLGTIVYSSRDGFGNVKIRTGDSISQLLMPIRGRDGAALAEAAQARGGQLRLYDSDAKHVDEVVFDTDYERFVVVSENAIRIFDRYSGDELARLPDSSQVTGFAFVDVDEYGTLGDGNTATFWKDDGGTQVIYETGKDSASRSGWTEFFDDSLITTSRVESTQWGVVTHTSFHDLTSGHNRLQAESFFGPYGVAVAYSVSEDVSLIATRMGEKNVVVKQMETAEEVLRVRHKCCLTALALSPSGDALVFAYSDNEEGEGATIELWDVASGRKTSTISYGGLVRSLIVSNSADLIMGSTPDTFWLWDPGDGELPVVLDRWEEEAGQGPYLNWIGDDHVLSIRYEESEIRVYDIQSRQVVWSAETNETGYAIGFSPAHDDAPLTVAASHGNVVKIWSSTAPDSVDRFDHEASVWGALLAKDSRLVTLTDDQVIHVWNARAYEKMSRIDSGFQADSAVVSRDGRWLAMWLVGGNQVRVWNLERRLEVMRLPVESAESASFSFDSGQMVTHGRDGPARIWPLEIRDVVDRTCNRLWRNMTLDEWQQFMGGEPYRATCGELPGADDL